MRIFALLSFLLLPSLCHAAPAADKIAVRYLGLQGVAVPPAMISVSGDGEEVACEVTAGNLSAKTVCFLKAGQANFLAKEDRKPVASVAIPAGLGSAILVFVPAGNPPEVKWKALVIDDSLQTFPEAGAFVVNLYNQDIRFVLGENRIMLKPGKQHVMPRPEKRDDFNMAPVVFQFQWKDQWVTASESMLRFVPGARYLMFTYVDPASKRPRIMTVKDSVMRPAEA